MNYTHENVSCIRVEVITNLTKRKYNYNNLNVMYVWNNIVIVPTINCHVNDQTIPSCSFFSISFAVFFSKSLTADISVSHVGFSPDIIQISRDSFNASS